MQAGAWRDLLSISVEASSLPGDPGQVERFYRAQKKIDNNIEPPDVRLIEDALSLSFARVGLVPPDVPDDLYGEIDSLNHEDGVVLIADSNALYNGAVHWLLQTLNRPAVWLFPFVVSLTQVQQRDASLKAMYNAAEGKKKIGPALRSRAFINGSLGLLERYKGRYQVVELDPSLLRYLKPAGKGTGDPDQSDVLEDRLLIEGIHSVLRSTRSRAAQRVVTSDVLLARILSVEGIPTLFIPVAKLGDSPVPCIRYDPVQKGFTGAPLRSLLWDLAHTFGAVRLTQDGNLIASLASYWPNKSPNDWHSERLNLSLPKSESGQAADSGPSPLPPNTSKTKNSQDAGEGGRVSNAGFTAATLPRASFPQMLRLLGALRAEGPARVGDLVARLPESDRPSEDTTRRALEILRRVGLVQSDGDHVKALPLADRMDNLLLEHDLDSISLLFKKFEPYKIMLDELSENETLPKAEVHSMLQKHLGRIGTYEAERLPRFHILLGQIWTDGDAYRDGASRPPVRDFIDAFNLHFGEVSVEGFANIVDLLPRICRTLRSSPWAAKGQLARIVAQGGLDDYTFEPAAGGRPVTRDEVISGSLDNLSIEPIMVDRLRLGEQPVFTVNRRRH